MQNINGGLSRTGGLGRLNFALGSLVRFYDYVLLLLCYV